MNKSPGIGFSRLFFTFGAVMIPEIQHISRQDIPVLVQIINESYRNDAEGAWTTEAHLFGEGGKRIDVQELEDFRTQPDNHILKYEKEGIVLGTVSLTEKDDNLYLGTLAVSPQSQGSGIGKKLLTAAKELAREKEKKQITLTVISARKELIEWYERLGFKKTGNITPFPQEGLRLSTPVNKLYMEEMVLII
ncbi:MAG: GNAT family N-acetyltransferase [Niabella sp.]